MFCYYDLSIPWSMIYLQWMYTCPKTASARHIRAMGLWSLWGKKMRTTPYVSWIWSSSMASLSESTRWDVTDIWLYINQILFFETCILWLNTQEKYYRILFINFSIYLHSLDSTVEYVLYAGFRSKLIMIYSIMNMYVILLHAICRFCYRPVPTRRI